MTRVSLTLKSRNSKTGPIPVSTSTARTCPKACPFNTKSVGGCYAAYGPLAFRWQEVTDGRRGSDWRAFLKQVAALPANQLWRHNQAGDLPGDGDALDTVKLAALVKANAGRRGFTYTHKPMTSAKARKAIADANRSGFTINLSGNNPAHADMLYDLGIAPVVTVLPANQAVNMMTPKGRKIVVCPATQRDDVTCSTCGLCARLRDCIVGFPAHGAAKRTADRIAKEVTMR